VVDQRYICEAAITTQSTVHRLDSLRAFAFSFGWIWNRLRKGDSAIALLSTSFRKAEGWGGTGGEVGVCLPLVQLARRRGGALWFWLNKDGTVERMANANGDGDPPLVKTPKPTTLLGA
jgi:hypothetical protein